MNEQIFTDVLNDILDELQQSNRSLKILQTTINDLQEKTTGFEQKLIDQQVIAPPADTAPIQELTEKAIQTIQQDVKKQLNVISTIVEAQPKSVIKQWRLCFFPDNDHRGNYKHLINNLTWALVGIAFILAGYFLILHNMDKPDTSPPAVTQDPVPPPTAPATGKFAPPSSGTKSRDHPSSLTKNRDHPPSRTKSQGRPKLPPEITKKIDTLYKMYMHKYPDSL